MCRIAIQAVLMYLRAWDRIILASRDVKEYKLHSYKETHVKTVFGQVDYKRAYYQKRSGGYVFLLDEAMGIKAGCGMVGENLAEQIVAECTDKSFRKAAGTISNLTGQPISGMTAWTVLQRYAQKVEQQEARLEELAEREVTGQLGNVSAQVLFQEYDDVWLNQQRPVRRGRGNPARRGRARLSKKPMHVGTAYTGWKQEKSGRYVVLNKVAHASFGKVAGFLSRFGALMQHYYDMDGIERVVVNGDGEGWIKAAAEESEAILQLDPFHRSQAIMRAVKDGQMRKAINDAFKEKDVGKALGIIGGLALEQSEETARKKLAELLRYLDNNRDSLLPWQERGIPIPEPPEGVEYRSMGLQEHNNCDLLTQRMKNRKGSWSVSGANNMAKILCLRGTVGLDVMFGQLPEAPAGPAPGKGALSSAKAPIYDGEGHDASWLYAGMPFEQVFTTAGREAIRGLLRQKPIADLRLI